MKNIFLMTVGFLLLTGTAVASNCPNLYPENSELAVTGTTELCNSFYVVRFDEVKNIPMFSAELLQPNKAGITRSNDFHPDDRLNKSVRAENSDYAGTGYDKGHMTPAEDASTPEEMHDTFLLSNMTPQCPTLNRQPWRMLEEAVHKKVNTLNTPTHIITGAIYGTHSGTIGKHNILIPLAYYKIIYLDSGIEAYYALNSNDAKVQQVSLESLQKLVPFVIK